MPFAKKYDAGTGPPVGRVKSSPGFQPTAGLTIVGTPRSGIPKSAVSTNPGYAALFGVRHLLAHCGVAALAATVPAALNPPARANTAAAARTLLLMDMTVPFLDIAVPCTRRYGAGQLVSAALIRTGTGVPVTPGVWVGSRQMSASGLALSLGVRLDRGRLRAGGVCRGLFVAVGGQERGQRGQCFLGSLLGGVVGAVGDDQGLHVVGGELHRVRDLVGQAVAAADAQHGHRQPPGLALLVLRDGGIQSPVDREAGVQHRGVAGESVDVMPDRVAGQGPGGLGGELPAEVDLFPAGDELVVDFGEPVEREVP